VFGSDVWLLGRIVNDLADAITWAKDNGFATEAVTTLEQLHAEYAEELQRSMPH
jgi:hypothetical protein